MIIQYELNKDDIISILSNHFGVDKKDVIIDCFMTYEGYGESEHEVPSVKIKINKYHDYGQVDD